MKKVELQAATATTGVALVTTTLTNLITLGPLVMLRPAQPILLFGWAQITTGADTTAVSIDIARSSPVPDTQVGERNSITLGAAAGSTEQFTILATDLIADVQTVIYRLRGVQVSATGNGTMLQSGLVAIML